MLLKLVLGLLAIAYGGYTTYLRVVSPVKLGKLGAMKEQWGETAGNAVHVLAYTVVPILLGIVLIVKALGG
jgi:hypothetical protein